MLRSVAGENARVGEQRERREDAVTAQEWPQRLRRRDEGGQAGVFQPKPQALLAELGAEHRDAQPEDFSDGYYDDPAAYSDQEAQAWPSGTPRSSAARKIGWKSGWPKALFITVADGKKAPTMSSFSTA